MSTILHALALAVIAAILFFGCVSEPKPVGGIQDMVVQNAEEVIGTMQPAKRDELQINCTLAVKQSAVMVGEPVDIVLNSQFPGSASFDLMCGDGIMRLIDEDALALETTCKFDTPGTYAISVKANGRECANASVEVRNRADGICSIDSTSIERDFTSYYYKWIVNFDGFSDGDVLTWICDSTVAKKILVGNPIWGMPRFEILSCDFPGKPVENYINVSISGVPCGNVSTRE